jgi:hypothetical protein
MRPQSLAARLLAMTPRGRRLFDLLSVQAAELGRLRQEMDTKKNIHVVARSADAELKTVKDELATAKAQMAVLRTILRATEQKAAFHHAQLLKARAEPATLDDGGTP